MPSVVYELDINLGNYQSIQRAEKIFGQLSAEIEQVIEDALEETGEKMEAKALESLSSYGLGGSEVASSVKLDKSSNGIKLVASSDHADYVEFGTGIVGALSPHPKPDGWTYDTNGHGSAGWFYYDAAHKLHWTAGVPSRPFMYESWLYGSRIVGSQVNKHLNALMRRVGL